MASGQALDSISPNSNRLAWRILRQYSQIPRKVEDAQCTTFFPLPFAALSGSIFSEW